MNRWSDVKEGGLGFFLVTTLLYVYPLMRVDYPYIDDVARSIGGEANWNAEGRFLMTFFYNALSLTMRSPDSFPLALIGAAVLMAFVLSKVRQYYFKDAGFLSAIVVLPLFFNPFFLSNLSYQYDGPVMVLGVAAITYAIVFDSENRWLKWGVPVVLLGGALAIYQPLINIFLGLCCIDIYRGLINRKSVCEVGILVGCRLMCLFIALVMYLAIVLPFVVSDRQGLVALDINLHGIIIERFKHVALLVGPLYSASAQWLFKSMLVLAGVGFMLGVREVVNHQQGSLNKGLAGSAYIAVPFMLVFLIPGVMLVFKDEQSDSRVMLGVGPLMVYALLIVYRLLHAVGGFSRWILILPFMFMIHFSYSYGQLLSAKKELENSLLNSLAYSVGEHSQLQALDTIYFSANTSDYWLPAAQGTDALMPIMPYVLSADFLLWPDRMVRAGITNVEWEDALHPAALVLASGIAPIVDNKFYAIYVFKDDGYIIIKSMTPQVASVVR